MPQNIQLESIASDVFIELVLSAMAEAMMKMHVDMADVSLENPFLQYKFEIKGTLNTIESFWELKPLPQETIERYSKLDYYMENPQMIPKGKMTLNSARWGEMGKKPSLLTGEMVEGIVYHQIPLDICYQTISYLLEMQIVGENNGTEQEGESGTT